MKYISLLSILAGMAFSGWAQQLPPVYEALENSYNAEAFEACVKMEKAVESFTHSRIDTLAANSFFYLGDAFNQTGDMAKALFYFEREKGILYALGMTGSESYSNSLSDLAYLYLQSGSYEKASATADELLVNDRRLFSPTDVRFVESVLYVAEIYLAADRLRDAENILLNTVKAQERENINRGLLLNKVGDLYTYTGQYSKASKYLTEAIDIVADRAGEHSGEYISTAISLGILYMNEGKYPQAEEIFEVALSHLDPSESAYASVLNNQALVFQSLGQLERAEKTLQRIRKIDSAEVGTSHPYYAITLSNLGLVYADLERFSEAESALTTALAIQKNNNEGSSLSFARKLNNLAKVFQMAGSPEKAVPLLHNALAIFKSVMGKKSPEYATSAYNLGLAHWRAGKAKTGYKYLKMSASIRARVLGKNHPKYAESILKIGEYQWEKKSVRDARHAFGEVFENYYFQIDETFPVLTEEEKSKFYYTNIRGAFDKFNSFAISHQLEEPGLISDAYNYVINTKACIMFATEKVMRSIMASGDTSLIQQFELWQASKEQIAKLYSMNQEHPKLDSMLERSNFLEKELARRSSVFEGQFVRKKYDWKEIQRSLTPGEAAVEVLRFKKYSPENGGNFSAQIYYAFLILTADPGSQPGLIVLENGNELESKYLRNYRNSIRYKLDDGYSYQFYFKPLAEYLKTKNINLLYFSPDGVYHQININGLQDPESGKFLIDQFEVHFLTNTRELAESKTGGTNHQPSVLIGHPKFNLEAGEVKTEPRAKPNRGGTNRTWRGGLLRYMRGEEGISMLPGTQVEIGKISELFGDESKTYTEEQATEGNTKNVTNPRFLHIATHGYFLEDAVPDAQNSNAYVASPLLNAGLILAGAENFLRTGEPINEQGDDGILTAFEAMNLNLDNTQLVVLSACETALGDVKNGEGVYGLQRAFKLAGAENIVMSLWSVDDDATQELMTAFYAEMLKTGKSQEAFRIAQQKLKEKYRSPFYWAAFVMVGR